MKRKRFTEEQIIAILKEAEAGAKNQDVCRKHGITETTFYKWRSKFGGMQVSDAKRLKGTGNGKPKAEAVAGRSALGQCGAERSPLKKLVRPRATTEGRSTFD